VSDAEWLQRLHECGLLRASFRRDAGIAALRDYLRQRERLLDCAAAHIQRMQKADADEPATARHAKARAGPRGHRHHRRDWLARHPRHRGRRT